MFVIQWLSEKVIKSICFLTLECPESMNLSTFKLMDVCWVVAYILNDLAYASFLPSSRKLVCIANDIVYSLIKMAYLCHLLFFSFSPWWEYFCYKSLTTRFFPSTYWRKQFLGTVLLCTIHEINSFWKYTRHIIYVLSMWNTLFCILYHIFMFF